MKPKVRQKRVLLHVLPRSHRRVLLLWLSDTNEHWIPGELSIDQASFGAVERWVCEHWAVDAGLVTEQERLRRVNWAKALAKWSRYEAGLPRIPKDLKLRANTTSRCKNMFL